MWSHFVLRLHEILFFFLTYTKKQFSGSEGENKFHSSIKERAFVPPLDELVTQDNGTERK